MSGATVERAMDTCRCGEPAVKVCHLCKSELCEFHAGAKSVSTQIGGGLTRIRLEPICYPNCTSLFGEREDGIPKPLIRA